MVSQHITLVIFVNIVFSSYDFVSFLNTKVFSDLIFSPYSDGSKCNGIRKGDLVKIKVWFEMFCLMGLKISSIVPPPANQSTQPLSNLRVS